MSAAAGLGRLVLVPIDLDEFLAKVEEHAERGAARALLRQAQSEKLETEAAGRLLGKSPVAMRAFVARHPDIPVEHVGGKMLLFDRAKLETWIAEQKRRPGRPGAPRFGRAEAGR